MIKFVMISLMWAMLAAACAAGQEDAAQETNGPIIQEIVITRAVEPAITETLDSTPTKQSFNKHTPQDGINAFVAAGLEVETPVRLEVDGHSPLPPTFVEALRFQIPEFEGRSGRIFSFESAEELQMVSDYYEGIAGTQASYIIVKDNLLVQISDDMPADLAEAYRDALEVLK